MLNMIDVQGDGKQVIRFAKLDTLGAYAIHVIQITLQDMDTIK